MNKLFNKALMVILAAVMVLSSGPITSIAKITADSPIVIVAEAAKKTHLNTTKKSIYIGKKYTLKLIDKNGKAIPNSKIKWSRSNKTVASVSKSGTVTGKKAGKIKITATYNEKKYTSVITVKSTVSLSKSKVTFKAGETAKKTIKVTCKDSEGIKWKTVEGTGIVTLSQAKKWSNGSKSLYITPTGKKFGTVKIKVYSKENSNSYEYLTIDVKKPYTLESKTKIPCIIHNFKSEEEANNHRGNSVLIIRDVSYKTPDTKNLKITVTFEASYSEDLETNYFIKYRIFDKNGFLVESDTYKSKLMMVGDKAKAEITITGLKPGSYTIEFRDYINNNSANAGSSTVETTAPAGNGSQNTETTTPTGGNGSQNTETTTPVTEPGLTAEKALAMYQKAAKDINEKGVAGYSLKEWQNVESINVSGNDTIRSIIEGFITTEENAEVKINAKGSEDAKLRMPASNCTMDDIQNITVTTVGDCYTIKIVMKDQINPSKSDIHGLNVMARNILYMEDIYETVQNDSTVKLLVKSLDKAEVRYNDYTIVATMTKDGNFVEINHYGKAAIQFDAKLIVGAISGNAVIDFNSKYFDFKY